MRTIFITAIACAALAGCGPAASPANLPGAAAPSIAAVGPDTAAPGEAVTIAGLSFEVDRRLNSVFFGPTQATVTSSTTTEIVAIVPAGVPPGAAAVTVATRAGTSSAAPFTVASTAAPRPSIARIDPPAGHARDRVRIEGSGFTTAARALAVRFGGRLATVVAATSTALTVEVPAQARSGAVVVEASGRASNAVVFYVTEGSSIATAGSVFERQGLRARDYLSGARYTHLVIEIDHTRGDAPSLYALNLVAARLSERCAKPGGVLFLIDDEVPDRSAWTYDDLRAFEQQHRDHHAAGETAVFYISFLGGRSTASTSSVNWLGFAYSSSSMALLKEELAGMATRSIGVDEIEGTVGVHELGHNLGLVNNGSPMVQNHEDPAHPVHDSSQGCIMYWEIGVNDPARLARNGGRLYTQFDAACIADCRANGGK